MIISEPFAFMYKGQPASMYVMRNDGYCWGRMVTADQTELEVDTRRDYYEQDDSEAAAAFIRAAQRGRVHAPPEEAQA